MNNNTKAEAAPAQVGSTPSLRVTKKPFEHWQVWTGDILVATVKTEYAARLIKAAPALLEALKATLEYYHPSQYRGQHLPPALEQTIRAAIAMAGGDK